MNQRQQMIKIMEENFVSGTEKSNLLDKLVQVTPKEIRDKFENETNLKQKYSQIVQEHTIGYKILVNPLYYSVNSILFKVKDQVEENIKKRLTKMISENTLEILSSGSKSDFTILPSWMFNTNIRTLDSLIKIIKNNLPEVIGKTQEDLKQITQQSGQPKNKQYIKPMQKYGIITFNSNKEIQLTEKGQKIMDGDEIDVLEIFNSKEIINEIKSKSSNVENNILMIDSKSSIPEFYNRISNQIGELKSSIKKRSLDIPLDWFIAMIIGDEKITQFLQLTSIENIFEIAKKVLLENNKTSWQLAPGESRFYETILSMLKVLVHFKNSKKISVINDKEKTKKGKTIFKRGSLTFVRDPDLAARIKKDSEYICESCETLSFEDSNEQGFVESHHVIPLHNLKVQDRMNLDVYENLISLCPNCHRAAHKQKRNPIPKVMKVMFEKIPSELKQKHSIKNINDLISKYKIK